MLQVPANIFDWKVSCYYNNLTALFLFLNFRTFTKLPSEHYIIEANLILQCAPEDVIQSDEIRTLIKDVADIRTAKIRTSIDDFIKGEGTYAKLNNLTFFEIHSLRHLLPLSLNVIDQIYQVNVSQ